MDRETSPTAAMFEHYSPGEILKPSHRVFRYMIAKGIMPPNEPIYDEKNFKSDALYAFTQGLKTRNHQLGSPMLIDHVDHLSLREWYEVERQLDSLIIEHTLMPGKAHLDELHVHLEKIGTPSQLPFEFNSTRDPIKPTIWSAIDQWLYQSLWRKLGCAVLLGLCGTRVILYLLSLLAVTLPIPITIAILWLLAFVVFNLLNQPRATQTPPVELLLKELSQNWDLVFLMRTPMDCWLMHQMASMAESPLASNIYGMEMWHPDDIALLCMHYPSEPKRYTVIRDYAPSQPGPLATSPKKLITPSDESTKGTDTRGCG